MRIAKKIQSAPWVWRRNGRLIPVGKTSLGEEWLFRVQKTFDLTVDFGLHLGDVVADSEFRDFESPEDAPREYIGTSPEPGVREVRALIGYLVCTNPDCDCESFPGHDPDCFLDLSRTGDEDASWTEEDLAPLLLDPACPLAGSGAWVREALFRRWPSQLVDGLESMEHSLVISFPDGATSHWQDPAGHVYHAAIHEYTPEDQRSKFTIPRITRKMLASSSDPLPCKHRICLVEKNIRKEKHHADQR